MLLSCGCVVECAAGLGAFSGGGVAVGWYPVGMWLFVGLGALFLSFLDVLLLWLPLLQWLQNTLFTHLCLM